MIYDRRFQQKKKKKHSHATIVQNREVYLGSFLTANSLAPIKTRIRQRKRYPGTSRKYLTLQN